MKHLQIALAIIRQGGKVLVARRYDDADHLPGMWEFPGGKCEPGEAPQACAIRESSEELGVKVEVVGERPAIEHEYPERRVTLLPFEARIVSGEPQALGCAECFWLEPGELEVEKFPSANASLIAELKNEF